MSRTDIKEIGGRSRRKPKDQDKENQEKTVSRKAKVSRASRAWNYTPKYDW